MPPSAFTLQRDVDETGVSGTGTVAEGVEFSDGTVALRWTSAWPTSVVFHDRGIASVEAVHGHGGLTRVVWTEPTTEPATGRPRRTVGPLVVDEQDWTATLAGERLSLTHREFELLALLASRPGHLVRRDEALNRVWGGGVDYVGDHKTLNVHVKRLRQKLGTDAIETVRGEGYRLTLGG